MINLFIGIISINVKDILNLNSTQLEIITLTRIPRLIAILLTRMSLSICGLIMQQLTQNKFVSPTTAGTMDCAKFGILISLIFFTGASFFTQAVIAFRLFYIYPNFKKNQTQRCDFCTFDRLDDCKCWDYSFLELIIPNLAALYLGNNLRKISPI